MKAFEDESLIDFGLGGKMFNESVAMINYGGRIEGCLRFAPCKIISVKNSQLNINYVLGKDYTLQDNKIVMLPNSTMPYFDELWLKGINMPDEIKADGKRFGIINCMYSDSVFIINHQIAVTYLFEEKLWDFKFDENKLSELPITKAKLKNADSLKIILYGDSISTGCNSSKAMHVAPFLPTWHDMVIKTLSNKYSCKIDLLNISEAGQNTAWAADNLEKRMSNAEADLVIIAFGMNDASMKMEINDFVNNIKKIMSYQKNKRCEFILVGSIIPNQNSNLTGDHRNFAKALYQFSSDNVKVVDVGALHEYLLINKIYTDMTGNNINHPNDFLARGYAMSILNVFK